jgi:hypothetical protein
MYVYSIKPSQSYNTDLQYNIIRVGEGIRLTGIAALSN